MYTQPSITIYKNNLVLVELDLEQINFIELALKDLADIHQKEVDQGNYFLWDGEMDEQDKESIRNIIRDNRDMANHIYTKIKRPLLYRIKRWFRNKFIK